MSSRDAIDVAVVGGGVVGAAAALGLARDGWQVALVESRPPPPWSRDQLDLRVYAIAPDSMAMLDALGVGQKIRAARAQPYRAMRVWDAASSGTLAFDADTFGRRELGWIVEHAVLVDGLWSALAGAGVRIESPAAVSAYVDEPGSDAAQLQLGDGSRLRARLVVAADGGASPVRGMAGIDAPGHAYGQSGLVAFVETALPHGATCYQRFLPGGPLAVLPFADGRSSIVWTLPDADAQRLHGCDADAFSRAVADAFAMRLGAMRLASERALFPLRRQLSSSQHAGRLVVVGDAAHVVHPLAGQGVNLGLRDVAKLRQALAPQRVRDADPSQARLARWARERRSANARAAFGFEAINRVFSNDAVLPTLLRGPLLGVASRMPFLQHRLWREAAGL